MKTFLKNWELTAFLDEPVVLGPFGYLWRCPDGRLLRLHVGRSFVRAWRKLRGEK